MENTIFPCEYTVQAGAKRSRPPLHPGAAIAAEPELRRRMMESFTVWNGSIPSDEVAPVVAAPYSWLWTVGITAKRSRPSATVPAWEVLEGLSFAD